MLRITIASAAGNVVIKLEGKITGPWVEELERAWRSAAYDSRQTFLMDVRNVTFIDPQGTKLLRRMCVEGVMFNADGCLIKETIEEIKRGRA